ncbi:MAG: CNNM domain-containing protein [bacterium]|jgi:metal transporter CNNM
MNIFISILTVLALLIFSAICSGLNVALLSLNISDLERKAKIGNIYAKKLLPLRKNSSLTIASILLCNVATISATSLVLHRFLGSWLSGLISTLLIVVFSEVIPQAIFIRHALILAGKFVFILRLMIIITYPLAKPLELLLDKILGGEQQALMSRSELGILIGEHTKTKSSELDDNEVEIMMGALKLSEKQVKTIMTPIDKTYWFHQDTKLTPKKIDEIKEMGYSRIPVFSKSLATFYGTILMKDLVDINFDGDTVEVKDLYLHAGDTVGCLVALDTLFRRFITTGNHLIPVERNESIIGIVTIEDLLEEILQQEIVDETDRIKNRI